MLDYSAYQAVCIEYINKDIPLPRFAYFHRTCWSKHQTSDTFMVCAMRKIMDISVIENKRCYKCRKVIVESATRQVG
jgi:hypothetical protein